MDRVDSDVVTVKDTKSCSDDLPLFPDGGTDCFFGNGTIHRRNNGPVDRVCHSFQIKKTCDPDIRNLIRDRYGRIWRIQTCITQMKRHDFSYMLDLITTVFESIIKIRRYQRTDLKDSRRSQTFVNIFAVGNLFTPWKRRVSKLFHTVGTVRIEIRKSQDPAIVKFHFVRWPGIQRHIFDFFDVFFHDEDKAPLLLLLFIIPNRSGLCNRKSGA